jgi:hypothetical protein
LDKNEEKIRTKIIGQVIDKKGRSISGARVKYRNTKTLTLFDGSYIFEDVEPGKQNIEVELEGYRKQEKHIDIVQGKESVVNFQIEEATGDAKIFGYILNEETKEPVIKGLVYLIRPVSNKNVKIDPRTGYYEFEQLASGTYDIWTSILEYEDEKRTVNIERGEARRQDFIVKKKEQREVPWG